MITTLRERSRTLTFRIAALLALALLPVGLISVATTYQLLNRTEEDLADTLLALTSDAAAEPEAAIRTATGVAKTLVSLIPVLRAEGWPCEGPLASLLRDTPELSLIAYVQADGTVACASGGQGNDLTGRPLHEEFIERPGPRVKFNLAPSISQTPVIIVSLPVITDGEYDGYVSASIPHRKLTPIDDTATEGRPLELITFNAEGDVLTASSGMDDVEQHIPLNRALAALAGTDEVTFAGETASGEPRLFAVVPIVPGQVFALGSWEYRSGATIGGVSWGTSMVFPLIMWIVSLVVAFYAVQRMVIKPTRNLRARMLAFMRSRKLVEPKADPTVPAEIRDMEETWMRLAENILHDEAELYDTIHQRTVLLKEVHHRVKNNLQLIVSIVGMKMRKSNSPTIKNALADIQQRVMSIARVHQNLYETSTAERVRANELLDAIVHQILASATTGDESIETEFHFDECVVYPDQAVPLSLAVSELVTNALKHLGRPETGGPPRLTVRLACEAGGDKGVVTVCNTLGTPFGEGAGEESTGLGEQLVRAFASQMEAKVTRLEEDGEYHVQIEFPIQAFDDEIVPSDHTHPIVARA
ncbi:sensor histidine kinase [Maritimibacter sp. DP1N21-5]|uniref:sensor histidine kinase n=1 Tax=Maritimibacter sp. DP1N21-5 TaxID=2836867 RepID=UPI001C45E0FC|nr:sensor histidine kinase [Maritimibacter sp. DP1N21-5]MBV7407771.1 sensor histidine kinase [Maritimibacter sp. DP1N21-5]